MVKSTSRMPYILVGALVALPILLTMLNKDQKRITKTISQQGYGNIGSYGKSFCATCNYCPTCIYPKP